MKKTKRTDAGDGGRKWTHRLWDEAVILDQSRLLSYPNVERVSLGWKERGGSVTRRYSVKIYVREKLGKLGQDASLPKTARVLVPIGKGLYRVRRIPTDVVWHIPAEFCALPTDLLNPLLSGAEMGTNVANVGSCGFRGRK